MPALNDNFACLANLPSMPALLMEALEQINNKQQNLSALADQISSDPSMAIRILRIVNSPFYGMSREIGSLREAIVLLGINRIRDMLISICFSKMLPVQHTEFNYNLFWRHSIGVAECTRLLANCTSSNPDLAFTAGLLHDIGDILIAILFPDKFSQLITVSASFGIEAEQQILGFNHTIIGGKAAQYWNLPVVIQEAIEQHETPPISNTSKSLGLLVYTANLLMLKTEQPDKSVLEKALTILNVSIDQAAYCANTAQQFADHVISRH
ncbi:HDOD domain-containing protein [Candidatus Methylobacter oryzae]|uniref:HDOD domain-containing protein n=1 Tax=Candidatus Methylobacter oryzae TaxID=2497749 RepID=A0ABY3C4U8_9GAMM|nr:HDOD domain-containing protein [Candidatus Methylobacter oryzae]TRW89714.1 HDOD domain-containing protein [Candidatus Methylobacter oryzae]